MVGNKAISHEPLKEGYDFFITDKWKKEYHFKILSFEHEDLRISVAIQVVADPIKEEPRKFEVLSELNDDFERTELLLKAKIKKGIDRKYLKHEDGKWLFADGNIVAGRLSHDENDKYSQFSRRLVIDGIKITIEDFVKMLDCYDDFNFKFQIIDPADAIE